MNPLPEKSETEEALPAEALVGQRLRELRLQGGFSLRSLANLSGLNVNTLSLIENGKSSPSVGTLQQLSLALEVPITAFFEQKPSAKQVVYTSAEQRPQTTHGSTQMQSLGKGLAGNIVQPFVVVLEPGKRTFDRPIVHSGHEFVYCLSGTMLFEIDQEEYKLNPGDSLVFESHLPHNWTNTGTEPAKILLILFPSDQREDPAGRHFSPENLTKEINMKIAVITDDGKTISQHFGRARYYQVFTIEAGQVVNREMRDKMGHSQFSGQTHEEAPHGEGHGMDDHSHNKHVSMAETIADCKALLCGGMGMGAYESMRRLNIQPIVTEIQDIDAAVRAFVEGKLVDRTELLH